MLRAATFRLGRAALPIQRRPSLMTALPTKLDEFENRPTTMTRSLTTCPSTLLALSAAEPMFTGNTLLMLQVGVALQLWLSFSRGCILSLTGCNPVYPPRRWCHR